MKILIINAGSSSIKFQLFEMDDESVIAKGTCHMIGLADPFIEYKAKGKELVKHLPMKDHTQALEVVLDMLVNSELKVINSFDEVAAVGHRCVQGGWLYSESVLITDEVIENLKQTKVTPKQSTMDTSDMDSMKFLESITKIYEKSGRSDLAKGLKDNLRKAQLANHL